MITYRIIFVPLTKIKIVYALFIISKVDDDIVDNAPPPHIFIYANPDPSRTPDGLVRRKHGEESTST